MSTHQEPAQAGSEIAYLGKVFIEQIRNHGRVHHRALLRTMRERLGEGPTETSQEVAMILRGKLRLRPRNVRDIESVRRALAGEPNARRGAPDAGEDSR